MSREKPEKVYERGYRPSHKAKSTRRTPCKTRYHAGEDHEGYGSDSAVSDLRSGTGGRERWSGEAVVGDSLTETEVGIDSVPEPTSRMSRHENTGFSMETFMRMLAEMEENRDRRREEADRRREEEREGREQERERKRGEEREAERKRQEERERKQEKEREAERQRERGKERIG